MDPSSSAAAAAVKRKNLIETDQIVESVVWFLFHIPSTVLQDFIALELELGRQQHEKQQNATTKKGGGRNLIHQQSHGKQFFTF